MPPIELTYYSDVLCVWAHVAQSRVDEVLRNFSDQVTVSYRFCSVFGDTSHKIGKGWSDRGGYQGFNQHLLEVAAQFDGLSIHPDLWLDVRPASSASAHLVMKAVEQLNPDAVRPLLLRFRNAFFVEGRDISRWAVQQDLLRESGLAPEPVRAQIDDGLAFAALEADQRDMAALKVQGSPTILLNNGRQTLYGNVGYRIIEANIRELLHSPAAGSASWC